MVRKAAADLVPRRPPWLAAELSARVSRQVRGRLSGAAVLRLIDRGGMLCVALRAAWSKAKRRLGAGLVDSITLKVIRDLRRIPNPSESDQQQPDGTDDEA